ncbi:hypothetical protein BDR26DRAFT_929552 [Obelidium mucronatum]|nr:hypothetical protein BDR26DRAFT_929552 [Obelidium mucronatum]
MLIAQSDWTVENLNNYSLLELKTLIRSNHLLVPTGMKKKSEIIATMLNASRFRTTPAECFAAAAALAAESLAFVVGDSVSKKILKNMLIAQSDWTVENLNNYSLLELKTLIRSNHLLVPTGMKKKSEIIATMLNASLGNDYLDNDLVGTGTKGQYHSLIPSNDDADLVDCIALKAQELAAHPDTDPTIRLVSPPSAICLRFNHLPHYKQESLDAKRLELQTESHYCAFLEKECRCFFLPVPSSSSTMLLDLETLLLRHSAKFLKIPIDPNHIVLPFFTPSVERRIKLTFLPTAQFDSSKTLKHVILSLKYIKGLKSPGLTLPMFYVAFSRVENMDMIRKFALDDISRTRIYSLKHGPHLLDFMVPIC